MTFAFRLVERSFWLCYLDEKAEKISWFVITFHLQENWRGGGMIGESRYLSDFSWL